MSKRTNRELVMLANTFDVKRDRVAGMYMSEKLDGMRCLWLPHTKDLPVADIPFANRVKDKREAFATGLWSRYGKIIHCPKWYTEGFPNYPLDGELYIRRGTFQLLMSTVKEIIPSEPDWESVKYLVFDAPPYHKIFEDGRINNPQYQHSMSFKNNDKALTLPEIKEINYNFDTVYRTLERDLKATDFLSLHKQRLLPFNTAMATKILEENLEDITTNNGEGLILRHPASEWEPIRSKFLLKVKKLHDAEARVIGYRAGQGKYLGMLGSLTVRFGDVIFELSGFTDEERRLQPGCDRWAANNAGELFSFPTYSVSDPNVISSVFPLESLVTFRYRELSEDGIPKEARYLRKHQ
jgi:DNA ligase-1